MRVFSIRKGILEIKRVNKMEQMDRLSLIQLIKTTDSIILSNVDIETIDYNMEFKSKCEAELTKLNDKLRQRQHIGQKDLFKTRAKKC
jgi:hypothetical protein